jgi:hypothetical protein
MYKMVSKDESNEGRVMKIEQKIPASSIG